MSRERYGLHFYCPHVPAEWLIYPKASAVQIYNLRQMRLSLCVSFCLLPTKNADYETLHQISLDSARALKHHGGGVRAVGEKWYLCDLYNIRYTDHESG